MKKNKVVIRWEDSCTRSGWYPEADMQPLPCSQCESVGYLIHKGKDKVILAGMISEGECNSFQYIPKGCIKEIRQIG